jgi:hypothetical protein
MSAALACGCSSSSTGIEPDATVDSGGSDASTHDVTTHDAARDSRADALPTDAAHSDADAHEGDGPVSDAPGSDGPASDAPVSDASDASDGAIASQDLVPGTNLSIGGITTDGYLVYYDASTQTYYAQPLAGGPVTTIYVAPLSEYAGYFTVIGNVSFLWSWINYDGGTLVAWSSGMAQGAQLTTSGLAYEYQTMWASGDSEHVAYVQNTSSDGSVGALYGAGTDGSDVTLLVSNIDINASFSGQAPSCFPRMVFQGNYAVASYCAVADGGALTPQLQAFSVSNNWASVVVVPNWVDSLQFNPLDRAPFTFPFAVDPGGGQIAAASASSGNGSVQVFPFDGGPGAVVDPTVQLTPSLSFTGSVTDPWSILYNNAAGALMQAYAANPAPQTLVEAGVNYFNALSGDGHWMLVSNATNNGYFADLSLVSTQNPGAPVIVASSAQYDGGPVSPRSFYQGGIRGFTTDSAYALAETNLTETNSGAWLSDLRSMSVAPPYTTKLLTTSTVDYVAARGSKVVVLDNYQLPDGGSPFADLDEVDPASSGATVNIARAVPGSYALSSDLTQIAYVVTAGSAPGIYVSTLP